jgi:hypothetical protein
LERFSNDPRTFRKALDKLNGVADGLWIFSMFVGSDTAFLKNPKPSSLRITIPRDKRWAQFGTFLQNDGYQIFGNDRAPPGGVLFARQDRDELSLELDDKEDLDWKSSESLPAKTIRRVTSRGFGCFMTSKYAVLVCGLQPRSTDEDVIKEIRKSIVARYEAQPQGSAKERWTKLGDMIYSIVELGDVATERDSFNGFLSDTNVFSFLSALT